MTACIWYVSKYVALPAKGSAGSRGFLLMREFVRFGHKALIITSDSNQLAECPELKAPYEIQELDGVRVYWVRTLKYRVAKSAMRVMSWMHFEWRLLRMPWAEIPKPDVVVVSSLSLLTILNGLLWRQRYKCRLVFEVRDIWPLTITEEGGFSKENILVRILSWIEKLGYRHSDAIVGTMPNLAEHVQAQVVGCGKKVYCIPMGIDMSTLADIQLLPQEYGETFIPKNKFLVAHVGSIGITNALDTLLNCAASMVGNQDIHFLIVGDGDLKEDYIQRYGNYSNITFGPKVPKSMVQAVLLRCDLVYFSVHKSKVWRFGQSLNKVVDYMLAGKPVVASYSGFPSMINEANCGTFVPADDVDALRSVLLRYAEMDAADRNEVGLRGRAWILEHRNYTTLAQNYLRILLSTHAEPSQGTSKYSDDRVTTI